MSNEYSNEQNILKLSTASCLAFAAFGIGLGLWNGSMVIIFDGAYSLISLALTLLALVATMYIHGKKRRKNRNLSQAKIQLIESSVVLIKGLVVTLLCLLSLNSAVGAIFSGGREVNAFSALIFGVINVVGCLTTYLAINKQAGRRASVLLKAESSQWLMDTVISAAVLLGFIVASVLMLTDFAEYAVYADPLMVIIASVYFISVPVKMVKEASVSMVNLWQKNQLEKQKTLLLHS